MKEEKNHPSPLQSWLIWSSGGLFFLLGFFHRVAPAVLHRELTVDFSLSASSLGALTSLYYYSYTAIHIPTGLLADLPGAKAPTCIRTFFNRHQFCFLRHIRGALFGRSCKISYRRIRGGGICDHPQAQQPLAPP